MPRVNFTPLNPHTTTREKFTENILNTEVPSNADASWADAVKHQQGLYRALYDHEAMAPNRQQTFMTPAAQKSGIYHTWDFVGRTLQFLYQCDYAKSMAQRTGQDKQMFEDAFGRTQMSRILVEDTSGKSAMLVNSNVDVQVPFSDEIKRAAADMGPALS